VNQFLDGRREGVGGKQILTERKGKKMKPLNSIREAQESYRKKQEGTGDPLVKPTEGQGRNSEHYEEKRRRPGPQPSDKNPRGGLQINGTTSIDPKATERR
jgi:hypothetical protein